MRHKLRLRSECAFAGAITNSFPKAINMSALCYLASVFFTMLLVEKKTCIPLLFRKFITWEPSSNFKHFFSGMFLQLWARRCHNYTRVEQAYLTFLLHQHNIRNVKPRKKIPDCLNKSHNLENQSVRFS